MAKLSDVLDVYNTHTKELVARVVLNGYNIKSSGPLGEQGRMRSFSLTSGSLWDPWQRQEQLTMHNEDGRKATIRIAALPADEDSFGLIEFL